MFKLLLRPISMRFLSDKTNKVKTSTKPKEPPKPKLSSKLSNTPRPPKDPADEGYAPDSVNHEGIEVADFVRPEAYRQFSGPDECLGPGAGKKYDYKNAHYFAYHRFSFVELQNQSLELRDERRISGGVQVIIEVDADEDDFADNSLEAMRDRQAECDEQLTAQAKDIENEKLQAWCDSIEKKQQEIAKLQISNKSPDEQMELCADLEKKKLDKSQLLQIKKRAIEKQRQEKQKMKKQIGKKVKEILAGCTTGLKTEKTEQDKVLAECKEMVKEVTDELMAQVLTAKGKNEATQEVSCKEKLENKDDKAAMKNAKPKESIEKCKKPKDKEADKNTGKCDKKTEICEEPKEKETNKKAEICEEPKKIETAKESQMCEELKNDETNKKPEQCPKDDKK
ncbi:GH13815 [Drosophila grimshawi]|uniref:GH13815 n=1 Tax=Drosophila grimshawi TaxID=7222 RepID=B4JR44_DROGR|nr:GH13815 [Drosophila grimshawi]